MDYGKPLGRVWNIGYALLALAILSLLAACGPAVSPTPLASPTPMEKPTVMPVSTPTPKPSDEPVAFQERFEETLDRWQEGADVPEDPAHPGQPIAWSIEVSPDQAAEGLSSARFTIDGKQDDGTIWLARPFDVEPDGTLRVRLAFDLWSASESFNTLAKVATYAGPRLPTDENDFDLSQAANQAAGWKTYEYAFDVRSNLEGQVWVALGISAVWETEMTYYVDNVRVDIAPADTSALSLDDPVLLLPESAEPYRRASADLDGDGSPETIVLTGWGGGANDLGYDFLQMFVIASVQPGEYLIVWQSEQLPTERAEALQVQDVNGDGLPEVLSVQAMGASGETLYLLGWQGHGYGWLSPHGGHFDGREAFGENGVRVEDMDGDGVVEVLGHYGPAASQIDVYGWDGQAYVYRQSLNSSGTSYERVHVAEAGLSLEVPSGWTQSEPGTWTAPGDDALRLGLRWADLEPPQEPEAALLPQPAQVLESEPIELPWGSGRRFTVEVYGEAVEGAGQAPVQAVEMHTLVVLEQDGTRRAFDFYVGAPTREQLVVLEPLLQHALHSVVLQ